jgi:PKD repeat protein
MNKSRLLSFLILLCTYIDNHAQIFEAQQSYFPDLAWGCIETADFDLDGDLDILISGRDAQNQAVTKLFSNDAGEFTEKNTGIENVMLSSAAWADLNGDKYPDLIISGRNNNGQNVCIIYRNSRNGTFVKMDGKLPGVSSGSIAVSDFDQDGLVDILVTGRTETSAITKLFKNQGLFNFKETTFEFTGVYNSSSAFADFDNDGFQDIVISGESGMNRYTKLYRNQKGIFTEMDAKLPQLSNSSLVCVDLDGDKFVDLIITGIDVYGNEKTTILSNDGDFKFSDPYKSRGFIQADYILPDIAYGSVSVADLDGDNDLDLILTGKSKVKIASVFLNEGKFNFKKNENSLTGVYHSSTAVLDYNGDKKLDILYIGLDEEKKLRSFLLQNKGTPENVIKEPKKESLIKPSFTFSLVPIGNPTVFKNETKTQAEKTITFNWNFGDGTESREENPSHPYAKEGRYTVVLTARTGEFVETYTRPVYVKPQNTEIVNFSDKQKLVLNTSALKLLQDYESFINQLGAVSKTDEKTSTNIREQIINLFLNRQVFVQNDLDPTGKTSKQKEIETYTSDIFLLYPDGIKISVDFKNARMTSVKQHGKSLYSVDIIASKRIDGNFNNKAKNANNYKQSFRIAFTNEGTDFNNFKFVGIRDYYEQSVVADEKSIEEVNRVLISKSQQAQIDNSCTNILSDYIRNLSLIVKSTEEESDKQLYEEAFITLFSDSSAQLYNDIDPEAKENSFKPVDYIAKYRAIYPTGINNISLNIDSAIYKPTLEDNVQYSRYIYVDKNFSGEYKSKMTHSFSENLAFKVVFKKTENSFQDFRIASIDQSALNFYQNAASYEDTSTFEIPKIERTGLSIGFVTSAGLGTIYNENLITEQLGAKDIWTIKKGINYSTGIEMNYFFTNKLGIRTGIYYSSFSTEYSIHGDTIKDGSNLSKDANGDEYIKMLLATNYLSKYSLSAIDIPVQLTWISSDSRKIGLFLKAGLDFMIPLSFKEEKSGSIQYFGYYPGNPDAIKELHIKELNFYSNTVTQSRYFKKSYAISILASIGLSIPVGYFSNIQIGPQILWGINDITGEKGLIKNTFNEDIENLGISLRNISLNVSYNYKF